MRGDPSDEAVLCTGNMTYELKIAETSNALLLSPDLCVPSNARKCTQRPIEVMLVKLQNYFNVCKCSCELLLHILCLHGTTSPSHMLYAYACT